jgi:hypothetical protein
MAADVARPFEWKVFNLLPLAVRQSLYTSRAAYNVARQLFAGMPQEAIEENDWPGWEAMQHQSGGRSSASHCCTEGLSHWRAA